MSGLDALTALMRRWGLSIALLSVVLLLGIYVLWWNNPLLLPQEPFDTGSAPTVTATEPLNIYRWDTLEHMRLVGRFNEKTITVNYERAAPRDPGVWNVVGTSRPLRLSDFDQVLLDNTLAQLRVLTVRRLLLTNPTPEQLKSFGIGAIEIILHGSKDDSKDSARSGQMQDQRLLIGDAAPTGSGYYFYLPDLDQVYLGYVNIPEALQHLLERSAAELN